MVDRAEETRLAVEDDFRIPVDVACDRRQPHDLCLAEDLVHVAASVRMQEYVGLAQPLNELLVGNKAVKGHRLCDPELSGESAILLLRLVDPVQVQVHVASTCSLRKRAQRNVDALHVDHCNTQRCPSGSNWLPIDLEPPVLHAERDHVETGERDVEPLRQGGGEPAGWSQKIR
jgi:hypothetical protein